MGNIVTVTKTIEIETVEVPDYSAMVLESERLEKEYKETTQVTQKIIDIKAQNIWEQMQTYIYETVKTTGMLNNDDDPPYEIRIMYRFRNGMGISMKAQVFNNGKVTVHRYNDQSWERCLESIVRGWPETKEALNKQIEQDIKCNMKAAKNITDDKMATLDVYNSFKL